MVRFAAALIIILLVTVPAAMALSCEQIVEPSVLDAANHPAVTGIVERETVAANPLPWGKSVSAATRVWGNVTVVRWKTTSRNRDACPGARFRELGTVEYDFMGPSGLWDGPVDGTVETLDVALSVILEQRFGAPITLEIGGWDRVMATLRVFPSLLGLAPILLIALASIRRRRRARREYLF